MEEGSNVKGKKQAGFLAVEEEFSHFREDTLLDDEAVEYRLGGTSRVYQPRWRLMEYESTTAFTRSAMKFVEHCLPEPDRKWAREMDAKTLRALLARIHCNEIALSTELGKRYFEVSQMLYDSDTEVERLKHDVAHWKDLASDRGFLLDNLQNESEALRIMKDKDQIIESQGGEIEDLKRQLEEMRLMAGCKLYGLGRLQGEVIGRS